MAEIFVNRRIDLGARRHKQAQGPAALTKQARIALKFIFIVADMLQHVDAEDGVPRGAGWEVRRGPFHEFMCRELGAVPGAKPPVRFDGDSAVDAGHPYQMRGHLANTDRKSTRLNSSH